MKTVYDGQQYDIHLRPSDWRYAAAIVGLVRYFHYHDIAFEMEDDKICYRSSDISGTEGQRLYLEFAEQYFKESMHHLVIEELLLQSTLSPEQEKLLAEKMKANTIIKKIFANHKYDGTNGQAILAVLEQHRLEIIQETYRNGKSLYANFCNTGCLLTPSGSIGRLVGYYMDMAKKGKSISYQWDHATYVFEDEPEFDFIPMAFSKTYESFFINNNYSIRQLCAANDLLLTRLQQQEQGKNPRQGLFMATNTSSAFFNYDVEVITKHREQDYFTTLFVRQQSIDIFAELGDRYKMLTYPCRLENGNYMDIERLTVDSILNGLHLDEIIGILLKERGNRFVGLLDVLIQINHLIYGGDTMDENFKNAKNKAFAVRRNLDKNKVDSYRQKLISALNFGDYDRFCEVLLQLSSYASVAFPFAYLLFEDFEKNKGLAYAFVNGLCGEYEKKETKEEQ